MDISNLQKVRYQYEPKLPTILKNDIENIVVETGDATESVSDQVELKQLFSNTYGMPVVTFASGKK